MKIQRTFVIFSDPSLESVSIGSDFIVGVNGADDTFFDCCLCLEIVAETDNSLTLRIKVLEHKNCVLILHMASHQTQTNNKQFLMNIDKSFQVLYDLTQLLIISFSHQETSERFPTYQSSLLGHLRTRFLRGEKSTQKGERVI